MVADLFEITVACRKPKVLSGPRWWHYYETLLGGLGLFVAVYIALPLLPPSDAELGWWFVIRAVVYIAVLVGAFRLGRNLPSPTGERAAYLTGEATRIIESLDDILIETSDLDVAAERVRLASLSRRDEVSQWLASFVLANAHYRLAAMPRSKRRRKMQVVDRARRAQIQEAGLPLRTST